MQSSNENPTFEQIGKPQWDPSGVFRITAVPSGFILRLSNSARKKRAAGLLKSDFVSPPVRQLGCGMDN